MSTQETPYDPNAQDPTERRKRFVWSPGDFEVLSPEEAGNLLGTNEGSTGGDTGTGGQAGGGGQQPDVRGPQGTDQPAGGNGKTPPRY